MTIFEILLIALGLSMDAFAVSICKGLGMQKVSLKGCALVGAWFGIFQALMPLLGFFLGSVLGVYIQKMDHWIAFFLLALIGLKMVKESFGVEEEMDGSLRPGLMATLAVATSIDAFAVGITFALLPDVNIYLAVSLIGLTTFLLSALGVRLGHIAGSRWGVLAERLGGIVLIGIGLKILLDHLGIL